MIKVLGFVYDNLGVKNRMRRFISVIQGGSLVCFSVVLSNKRRAKMNDLPAQITLRICSYESSDAEHSEDSTEGLLVSGFCDSHA